MKLFSILKKDAQKFPSKKVEKVVANAVKFLNKSPIHSLPLQEKFLGCGVYVLYYGGFFYDNLIGSNLTEYFSTHPIYIGKAAPPGWRNGRKSKKENSNLWKRICEHITNIEKTELSVNEFFCRYVVLDDSIIAPVEARLIRSYNPLWNCIIDGFGNHHPGETRFNQARPDWDILHPGRPWAEKMSDGIEYNELVEKIKKFLGDK